MPFNLSQADEEALADAGRKLAEATEICRKCRACGMDTTAQDSYIAVLRQRLEDYRREFGRKRVE